MNGQTKEKRTPLKKYCKITITLHYYLIILLKVSQAAAVATMAANRVINYNNKLITILIEEFCK